MSGTDARAFLRKSSGKMEQAPPSSGGSSVCHHSKPHWTGSKPTILEPLLHSTAEQVKPTDLAVEGAMGMFVIVDQSIKNDTIHC